MTKNSTTSAAREAGRMQHTPGPWHIEQGHGPKLICAGQRYISTVRDNQNDSRISNANARLIAAAPELLQALVACEAALTDHGRWLPDKYQAAAHAAARAIAKATGGAL